MGNKKIDRLSQAKFQKAAPFRLPKDFAKIKNLSDAGNFEELDLELLGDKYALQ